MEQERRKEGRKSLGGRLQGRLSLAVAGRNLPVESVVDVSPLGVGVLVLDDVAVGLPVEVTFRDETTEISWSGITVWSFRREFVQGELVRPAVAVGIQLFSPTLLHTLLREDGESLPEN